MDSDGGESDEGGIAGAGDTFSDRSGLTVPAVAAGCKARSGVELARVTRTIDQSAANASNAAVPKPAKT